MKKGEKYIILGTIVIIAISGIVIFSSSNIIPGENSIQANDEKANYLLLEIDTLKAQHEFELKKLKNELTRPIIQEITQVDNSELIQKLEDKISVLQQENRSFEREVKILYERESSGDADPKEINALKTQLKQLKTQLENEQSKKLGERGESTATKHLREDFQSATEEISTLKKEIENLKKEIEKLKETN